MGESREYGATRRNGAIRGVKVALLYLLVIAAIATPVLLWGRGFSERRWGEAGVEMMWVAAAICGIAGLLAVLPLPLVAAMWPKYLGQAVFAGTTIRMLATLAMMVGYQMLNDVHMPSFLTWLLMLYLLLMAAETALGVALVRREAGSEQAAKMKDRTQE